MTRVPIPIALTALVSILLGLPLALFLRRQRDGFGVLVSDALVFGFMLVALAPTLYGWMGAAGVVVFVTAWATLVIFAVVRRPAWPAVHRPDLRTWVFIACIAVVAVTAIVLRLHNDNFTPWVGDMGGYVNWANQFARTGVLSAAWPPLFPAYLALASWAFGPAATTASLALAGLVVIVAASRLLSMMRVNRWIILLVAGLITVNVHAIWYSYFPASEALAAPFYLAWLITIVGAIRAVRPTVWLVLSAVVTLALGLARASGPLLLVPYGMFALLSFVVVEWRRFARRAWMLLAAGIAGSAGAFWYGISRIPSYYVDSQVRSMLPGRVADLLEYRLHAFDASPWTALGLLLVVALVALIAWRIPAGSEQPGELEPTRPRGTGALIVGWVLTGLLVAGIAAGAVINAGGWQVLERMGLEFAIVGVVALTVTNLRRFDSFTGAVVLLIGTVSATFVALQTYRLGYRSDHAFFLYWDRYFVSEVLPSFFVLTGFSLNALFGLIAAQPRFAVQVRRLCQSLVALVMTGVVVIAGVVVTERHALRLIVTDSYMRGAYSFQAELDAMIPDRQTPVLWTKTSTGVLPDFFFPNTWMAFAVPMATSFGYNVRDLDGRDHLSPDVVADQTMLMQTLSCTATTSIVVFEVRDDGPSLGSRIDDPALVITQKASVRGSISLLSQPPSGEGWQHLEVTTDVWVVSVAAAASLPQCAGS